MHVQELAALFQKPPQNNFKYTVYKKYLFILTWEPGNMVNGITFFGEENINYFILILQDNPINY